MGADPEFVAFFPFSPQIVAGENENCDVKALWLPRRIHQVKFGFIYLESFWKAEGL